MSDARFAGAAALLLAACSNTELGSFSARDSGLVESGTSSGGASSKGGASNGGAAAGATGKGGTRAGGGGATANGGSGTGGATSNGGATSDGGGTSDGGTSGDGGAIGNGGASGAGAASTGGGASTGGRAATGGAGSGAGGAGGFGAGGRGTGGATGSTCGGFLGTQCPGDEWCDYDDSFGQCGNGDAGGVCRARPKACTREYSPVCGCDGQFYSNPCTANAAGVDTSTDTSCFAGDGGAGTNCSSDQDCRKGLKCCYPCGIPDCQNQCMLVQGNSCPLIP